MDDWTTPTVVAAAAALLAVLVVIALTVALVRTRRATAQQLARAEDAQRDLLERLKALERPVPVAETSSDVVEFVVTDLGEPQPVTSGEPPARIEGRLFADVVLRESVVKAASWTHGIRTALSAENRNRVRFEVRRETKRSVKQRRADTKVALREYYARQDAAAPGPDPRGDVV